MKHNSVPTPYHYDTARPLPEYTDETAPELIRIHDLTQAQAPIGAAKYVKTKVHEVKRPNGSTGFQVVNEMAPGVSLLPLDVVNGHGYAILVTQQRYPHTRPEDGPDMTLEMAAHNRRIGRWGLEIVSGGVEARDASLEAAVIREAEEEAGIQGLTLDQIKRIYPELKSSVSVNDQPFNLFAAKLEDGQWDPARVNPDIEEGDMTVAAYRLDTAVPEMIDNGTIWEMSAVTAIGGLYRLPEFRQYL